MPHYSPIRLSLAVPIVLMTSQAACADLTPAQVWGDWKQYMSGLGYQVTAQEAASGGDLTVSDLTITAPAAEASGKMVMSTGPLAFVQDAGVVNIVMPPSMPFVLDAGAAVPGGNPWRMDFDLSQTGHTLKVSGDADAMTYDYSAVTMALALQQLVTDGETFGKENARINITATDMRTVTTMTAGDLRQYVQNGTIAAMDYDVFLHNPLEDVKVALTGTISALAFDGTTDMPTSVADASDVAQMLKAGFAVAGAFTYGPGSMNISVQQPTDGDFAASTTSDGGRLGVSMGAQALAYDAQQNNLKMSITSAELPFPVELSMAQAGFNLGMPIAVSEVPQDFSFGMNFTDFVMADLLWSIFDPAAQLPRDPATVQVDVSGKAKMLVDIMDPEATASADAPGEIHALTVDKILFDAVGARVDASGEFTFDNSDTTTYAGMPKPVGVLNVAAAGGNALLDKLVAMGILPEQQAMGARMMMGLFAVPGDAPDTLKSKVEFNEAGQILANGQRIK